jgi:endonuclease/exonuclease/phosphatase family metal-dependent hydrolase
MALICAAFSLTACRGSAQPSLGYDPNNIHFCFWNVENLFDDKDDKRNAIDEEYDQPFSSDEKLRTLKYENIASALLKMNNGNGPDVIALVEVESVRAADLLQKLLNSKLKAAGKDDKLQYKFLAMRNLDAGRHIAPAIISRLNVALPSIKQLGSKQRILETQLYVNGHILTINVSHWTSQLRQDDGRNGSSGREKYAITIYERFREITRKNPTADFLACGDFNDTPDAPSLQQLGAIADPKKVLPLVDKDQPMLNLMAGKDPQKFGTIWYNGKPLIYDHICVSAGMLDNQGWSVLPDTVQTETTGLIRKGATRREPWRFGNPNQNLRPEDRGYADHFPVTVRLKVAPPESKK